LTNQTFWGTPAPPAPIPLPGTYKIVQQLGF